VEENDREVTGATRSQNVVITLPHDWAVIDRFLAPALERVNPDVEGTQLLVLTQDGDAALAIAQAAPDDGVAVLPVTGVRRAERVLRARGASVVAGSPADIAALLGTSVLKLDALTAVVIAWGEEVVTPAADAALETVMGEVPKEASRTMVLSRSSADVDAFLERYMRRARRAAEPAPVEHEPVSLQYVTVPAAARVGALRRLLDELDPPSAAVIVRSDDIAREVEQALRTFGYPEGSDDARVMRADSADVGDGTALVVLYDMPADAAALRRVTDANPVSTIAFAQPRQLAHLRAIAGGRVSGYTLPEPAFKARQRDDKVRADLRNVLSGGIPPREVLVLEPLLDEFDAVEIAAAALRLLERERDRAAQLMAGTHTGVTPKGATAAASAATGAHRKIFITIGERDGVQKGDIVGMIANEGGITGDKVGRVDIRDNHSLVEIAAADVERVVEKLNGASVRGRRIVARLDQERSEREGAGPARSFDRGAPRGGPKGPPRSGGFDRGDRGDRPPRRDFGDRPARPSFDRGDRGERPDRGGDRPGPRSFDRGPRAGGGGFDRGPRPGGDRDRGPRPGGAPRPGQDRGPRGAYDERDRPGLRPGASEQGEWAERADRMNNAKRPRRDDA
jgi:ATP-dependent RNA helicase DeaD